LHSCCAPCSTVALRRLAEEYAVTVFFYGPNIHPRSEFLLRLEDQRSLCRRLGFELIEGDYRPADWGRAILAYRDSPEGGLRCQACYRQRMLETARQARLRGCDYFGVTLTVSRHKNSKLLCKIGREVAESIGLPYLEVDLKKKDGFNISVDLSRKFGLRRQDYCGCSFSLSEARARRMRSEVAQ
jgi:predicted adenine nucleotide alpha hydrolase (AANH) superfamily ATPase